jgi:hypothetical protein
MLGGRFLAGFSHDSVSLAEYFAPIAYPARTRCILAVRSKEAPKGSMEAPKGTVAKTPPESDPSKENRNTPARSEFSLGPEDPEV